MATRLVRRKRKRRRSWAEPAAPAASRRDSLTAGLKKRPRLAALALAIALASGTATVASLNANGSGYATAEGGAIQAALVGESADLAGFYEARRYEPVWVERGKLRPEAKALISTIAAAGQDGLDPERYGLSALKTAHAAAQTGEHPALARFEVQASRAFAAYVNDLHTPAPGAEMIYTDPAAAPSRLTAASILTAAGGARSLGDHLKAVRRMNPVYEGLRRDLALYRANAGGDARERLILLNMERARAMPANPGPRFIMVDAAAATLWLYENGRPVDSMKVVVGKQNEQTPFMAGVIRYALFNPYWNVPEDMIRDQIGPQVLRAGPAVLASRDLEALSDWSPQARIVDPATVDWSAVASGAQYLRVRQRPGPTNMMGDVKFMLPNELGIYLHDTPNKALFARDDRFFSSGCVRLEDAPRLARWLFGEVPDPATPEHRVDLKAPVPVYFTYLTAAPSPAGITFRPDVYRRDAAALALLSNRAPIRAAA